MHYLQILFLVFLTNTLFAQYYTEELVEIKYETNEMVSIKIYDNIPYIDQMLGGVVVDTDKDLYTFTGQGGETKLYTADIITGEIQYEVEVPQIQMLQYRSGSEDLIGISKDNLSGEVYLAWVNYETGDTGSYPIIPELQYTLIDTHNSAIDTENDIYYFVGLISGTDWSIISIDATTGVLINHFNYSNTEYINGIAFDKDRNKLLAILTIQAESKSLVEIDPINETFEEIQVIPELVNGFGGHRYWAYDDMNDRYFFIGLDIFDDSYLYVLDSKSGDVLYKNPYPDEVWIMEEHSPLELRFSPNTQQLLGLRKGETLPPVNTQDLSTENNFLKISPNPSHGNGIKIQLKNKGLIESILLIDINGTIKTENRVNANCYELETNVFPGGIYLIVCVSEQGIYRQKVILN